MSARTAGCSGGCLACVCVCVYLLARLLEPLHILVSVLIRRVDANPRRDEGLHPHVA